MTKRILALLLAALLWACGPVACGPQPTQGAPGGDRIEIVTTIFPEYDWVKNVLGDNPAGAEVTMLLDSGIDLHSFQPTAEDILRVATCDLFLYVGGESDKWAEDALRETPNPNRIVINLLDALGDAVKAEEIVEGMEAEEEEEHAEDEAEYDEHVWLSLKNAAALLPVIRDALVKLDPAHEAIYGANAAAYGEKLAALDEAYAAAVDAAPGKTLLFGDRFPFRYLADDYGLAYYAAFAGCSAETEASFETVAFLAGKVDELGLRAVLTIEGTNHRIAETIVENTRAKDQRILTLNSLQSVTAKDVQNGAAYLSLMEANLAVLQDALK